MILLVDIGNTRVKWTTLRRGKFGRMKAALHGHAPAALSALVRRAPRGIERVVAVNVLGAKFERALGAAVRRRFGVVPEYVRSTRQAGGVRNGYTETWRLGADRWVGVIGAYALARGRAVVVANIGTALTIDTVSASGRHLGGAIIPGPAAMIASLLTGTHGIARRARGGAVSTRTLFAGNTASALAAGASFASAALVERAVREATRALETKPVLILTGGAAPALARRIERSARIVPDLVLRGLAVLAGA